MKKIFSFFLVLVASIGMMFSSDIRVNDIYYDFDTNAKTASVTYRGQSSIDSYKEYNGAIVIPSTVTFNSVTYSVTSIGEYAFAHCSGLTSVTIPNSVTSIGDGAFYNCKSLTSVTIPNSVTSIGSAAFEDCPSLTSLVYNAHVFAFMPTSYSGAYTIPDGIESIVDGAFIGCSGLTSVTIPNSVTSIGSNAFRDCTSLTSVTIPNSVTSIGNYAFQGCSGLTSITIPNSVTSIGDAAFLNCNGLATPVYNTRIFAYIPRSYSGSFVIPEGIEVIAGYAFFGSEITSITIPSSLKQMAKEPFNMCYLDTVVWNARHCEVSLNWTECPFYHASVSTIIFGDEVEYIPHYLCREQTKLTSISIPSSVTFIANDAFRDCTGLTKLNINDIAAWCKIVHEYSESSNPLYYAKHLYLNDVEVTNLVIPDTVTSIGEMAFINGIYLDSVTIPNSVTSIGSYAFASCSGLTSVTIPNSVTSIGYRAFSGCSGLTSVTIGNSITSIGESAFGGCSGLTSVTIDAETPPTYAYGGYLSFNNTNDCPIYVPCGSLDAYQNKWKKYASRIKYKPLEYEIIGKVNSAEMGSVTVPTLSICDSLTAVPNKGYHFVQWSDGVTENPRVIDFTQDTTLTAEFAINVYNVRFYGFEKILLGEQSVEHGAAAIAPDVPVEKQYEFIGWDKDFSNVQSDLDVYAQYKNKSEATENIEYPYLPYKILNNGNVYILRGEKTYTLTGQELK